MGEPIPTAVCPAALTPRTLNQVYRQIVAAAQESVQVGRQLVAVFGQLGPLRDKGVSTLYFYEVHLSGDGETVYLDIPKELIRKAGICEGDSVKAIGVITTQFNQFTTYRLLFKLNVSDIMLVDAPADVARQRDAQDKLALLKGKTGRVPFPHESRIYLSVIHSTSGQVSDDFQHEIDKVANDVEVTVEYIPVNMTNPKAIAEAIEVATGDILAIIRGGGPVEQFRVFEDSRVIHALARRNDTYRVLGLGHTHDTTLLDVVSDFPAKTPSLAGSHIREQIERHVYPLLQLRMERTRNAKLEAKITSLETARSIGARKRPRSMGKSLVLLLVGVLLGIVLGVLVAR
jgi:exonuclease VII large subunit